MRYHGLSDTGLVRDHNEDAWSATELESGHVLCIVSDGVGGRAAGEVASRVVTDTLPQVLQPRIAAGMDAAALGHALIESLQELSRSVWQQSMEVPGMKGLAATVVCALVAGDTAVIGHMGDSRVYLLRNGQLSLLTRDHTVVQMLVDIGEVAEEDAREHPAAGRLTQAVGMEQDPLPGLRVEALKGGDVLLLCSDGLHGMVDDSQINELLRNHHDPEEACRGLVAAALEAGGRDNVTVLVIEMPS